MRERRGGRGEGGGRNFHCSHAHAHALTARARTTSIAFARERAHTYRGITSGIKKLWSRELPSAARSRELRGC